MARPGYPCDRTDAQWWRRELLIPPAKPGGRPRSVDVREVVNAILYVDRNGVTWRSLPHDFPPGQAVYRYFRAWRLDGTRECIHDALCDQVRAQAGQSANPSAAIIDSQSVKTTEKGGHAAAMQANA